MRRSRIAPVVRRRLVPCRDRARHRERNPAAAGENSGMRGHVPSAVPMTDEPAPPARTPFHPEPTSEQKERVRARTLAWLESRWPLPRECPIDRNTNWAIGDVIEAPLYLGVEGGLVFGAPRYLFVPVSCTTCGYTHLFNAIQIGVLEPKQP
jgi:hypothetical protein